MSVCIECARRRVWNESALTPVNYSPVECEPCQARGIGCEDCEHPKLRLCFRHALKASERKAEQAAAIRDVVQAARELRERTRRIMVAPYFQPQLDALCQALARLD